jgi:hypothetical protein
MPPKQTKRAKGTVGEGAAGKKAVPTTSSSPERLFSSVGLVKSDLRGRLLDNTLIDVMWVKQVP